MNPLPQGWIEKHLAGGLSEEECRQLEKCLLEDIEARRSYLEACSMEMELFSLLRERRKTGRIVPQGSWRVFALAAGILVLFFLTGVFLRKDRNTAPPLAAAAATPPAEQHVATLPTPETQTPVPPEIVEPDVPELPPARLHGKLRKMAGKARLTDADGTMRDLPETEETIELRPDELLALNFDVQADLELPDGTHIHLHRGSRLRLRGDVDAPVVFLQQGGIDVIVAEARKAGALPKFLTAFVDVQTEESEFRLLTVNDSSWVALRAGEARITRLSDGQRLKLGKGNYAAAHPAWPYQVMWAEVCPMWKHVSTTIAGDEYP